MSSVIDLHGELHNIVISEGDTWSAGRAINIKADPDPYSISGNIWDQDLPHAEAWRQSLGIKIDFSDVTLETPHEEIAKRKETLLEQIEIPTEEEITASYTSLERADREAYTDLSSEHMFDMVIAELVQVKDEDYTVALEYVEKLIDNRIELYKASAGLAEYPQSPWEIKSPFRSKLDVFLGREGKDPFVGIKEDSPAVEELNIPRAIEELTVLKKLLPQTPEEHKEFLAGDVRERFIEEHFHHTGMAEKNDARVKLCDLLVQLGARENVSQAYDEQLENHRQVLEAEKSQAYIRTKKEEIKKRLKQSAASKEEAPLSGTVIADRLAGHIIAHKRAFDEDKRLGIIEPDEQLPMMTPEEGRKMANNIQRSVVERQRQKSL